MSDAKIEEAKDEAVTFVFTALTDALGLDSWTIVDGSETWEGDVRATLWGILRAARVLDPETDEPPALPFPPARKDRI